MHYPNDYKTAIQEFETLDDSHKEPYLYAFLGYALYLSQNFEKLLMNLIWGHKVANRKGETKEEMNAFFDKYEFGKHSMGRLIKRIKTILSLSEEESIELKQLLNLRNFIVHKYFIANERLLYAPNGYKVVIRDFLNFINLINDLEPKLHEYQLQFFKKVGLSKERIQLLIDAEVSNFQNAEIEDSYQSIPEYTSKKSDLLLDES